MDFVVEVRCGKEVARLADLRVERDRYSWFLLVLLLLILMHLQHFCALKIGIVTDKPI